MPTTTIDLCSIGRSNSEVYSEEEVSAIRRIIADSRASAKDAEKKIEELLKVRDHHAKIIDKCKIAIAPHKILPLDIIREIFVLCADRPLHTSFYYKHRLPTQMMVSHVCSGWRRIALAAPELWNDIYVWSLNGKSMTVIKEYLLRSGGSLLTFRHFPLSTVNRSVETKLLDTLATHRLVTLRLQLSLEGLSHFYQFSDETLSHLETLNLEVQGFAGGDALVVHLIPDKFPRLKYLNLGFNRLQDPLEEQTESYLDLHKSVLPHEQLVTLKLYAIPSSNLAILMHCSSLEKCNLELVWDGPPEIEVERIILRRLLSLTVENHGRRDILPPLLRFLDCPNLSKLSLDGFDLHLTADMCKLLSRQLNLQRLRAFRVSNSNDRADIGTILRHMPSLDELGIQNAQIDGETMNQLAKGSLGPRLTYLSTGCKCSWDEALSMAESRREKAAESRRENGSAGKVDRRVVALRRIEFGRLSNLTKECVRRRTALCKHGTIVGELYVDSEEEGDDD